MQAVDGEQVPQDATKARLTVIGSAAERQAVLGDLGTSGHPHALFENVSPTRAETLRYFDVFGVPATPASFVALYATLLRRHVHFVDVVARCPDSSLHTYAGKSHNLHHDVEDDLVHTLTAMVARA